MQTAIDRAKLDVAPGGNMGTAPSSRLAQAVYRPKTEFPEGLQRSGASFLKSTGL